MKTALLFLALGACGAPPEPRLSVIQREVFSASCAFSTCHGSSAPKGELDLRPGKSYAALVGRPSARDPEHVLVVPGDPDASYLIDLLYGRGKPTVARHTSATIMPPPDTGVLEESWKAAVREWVTRGARDD